MLLKQARLLLRRPRMIQRQQLAQHLLARVRRNRVAHAVILRLRIHLGEVMLQVEDHASRRRSARQQGIKYVHRVSQES